MKIIADLHTHSVFCDHAFSTIEENARAASEKGMRFLGVTEHGSSMAGAPSTLHFGCLVKYYPAEQHGVKLLKGAEVNIVNFEGELDLSDNLLSGLHWVIASMHSHTLAPGTVEQHTQTWLEVAKNPHVDVIGHCGHSVFEFDYERVIPEFARNGKIVEINNHSFTARSGSDVNCPKIARLCAKHGVRVIINSDAHHHTQIGVHNRAIAMLEEIDFPQELILNADYDRLVGALNEITGLSWAD